MKLKPIVEVRISSLKKFDCGVEPLNTYFHRFAKKNDRLGIGKTYILMEDVKVLGYYTISMAQIEFKSLPKTTQTGLPRYPLPATRIGRLAVSLEAQGKGFGEYLLMDALARSVRVSEDIALYAMIVDAKDPTAKNFYLR